MAGFPGGLRLDPRKIASHGTIITPALPERLLVPLLQHQGEPARICAEIGETVGKGQRIGEANGPLSAHVHAPTSGQIAALVERDIGHASGRALPCIELIADGRDAWSRLDAWPDWQAMPPSRLIDRLREAGVVGLGGGVFPTDRKLATSPSAIHTLILNGAECEPYIACDDALLREHAREVLAGGALLAHALAANRCLLALEDRMTQALTAAHAAAMTTDAADAVTIRTVPTRYPQGGERQLIRSLTGIEIGASTLPHQHGVLCINVGTAVAAWRAVVHGEAVVERIVTVTGPGVARPGNVRALLGTPVAHLVETVGGYTASAQRLLLGGPMMGQSLSNDQVPIGKSGNCVLVLAESDLRASGPELPCIRCGECARVCPSRLLPQQLHFHIQAGQWPQTRALGLIDCIECGLCAHVCPSHIGLVEGFRYGKGELAWQQQKNALSDHSRDRHQARQERLERLAAERADRLQARETAMMAVQQMPASTRDTPS